ncbi:unnamed protein product [Discosporangium mesarthrocarpum]
MATLLTSRLHALYSGSVRLSGSAVWVLPSSSSSTDFRPVQKKSEVIIRTHDHQWQPISYPEKLNGHCSVRDNGEPVKPGKTLVHLNGRSATEKSEDTTLAEKKLEDLGPSSQGVGESRWQQLKKNLSPEALKQLVRDYGSVAVVLHGSVFSATFGSFYWALDQGMDIAALVANVPLIAENLPSPSAGNLAAAWGLTTITGPARGVLTITLTPRVARFWRGRDCKRKQQKEPENEREG